MSTSVSAVKGIAITPPVIGRIMMGHIDVDPGGKSVPHKDDYFTITTLVQRHDRSWETHPIMDTLQQHAAPQAKTQRTASKPMVQHKLQTIPIRIAYNKPALNLHSSYSSCDPATGRMLCTSDGQTARRTTDEGVATIACPRPETCAFGKRNQCKNLSRFYMLIEGQDDEFGTFIFRSSSWNSLTHLSARLAMLHGLTGGRLAGLPLMLQLKAKSTTMSLRKPMFYADLVCRSDTTLAQAVSLAKDFQKERAQAGLSEEGMEEALAAGLMNSDFAEQVDDMDAWLSYKGVTEHADRSIQGPGLRGLDRVRIATASSDPAAAAAVAETNQSMHRQSVPQPSDGQIAQSLGNHEQRLTI